LQFQDLIQSLRFYRKKRGSRRTGPQWAGRLGESLLHAVVILIGAVGIIWLASSLLLPDLRAQNNVRWYRQTRCEIRDKNIESRSTEPGYEYRPKLLVQFETPEGPVETWAGDVVESFSADREDAENTLARFQVGKKYACWYDPEKPTQAVVIREFRWWPWLVLVIPISLFWFGSVGLANLLWRSIASSERRAAMTTRARGFELAGMNGRAEAGLHAVPSGASVTDSPGLRLAYRLPIEPTANWLSVGMATVTIVWNVVVVLFAIQVIGMHILGRPNWLLTLLLLPLIAIGLWTLYQLARQMLYTVGIGATRLEISDHPLYPGQDVELYLFQAGRLPVRWLRVALISEEQAVYKQGTDTRSSTHPAARHVLSRERDIEISFDAPMERTVGFKVPPEAMHSFASLHSEVNWYLVVSGKVSHWPVFERRFPVFIHPTTAGETLNGQTLPTDVATVAQ
jgi:hypothetical protein